MITVKAYNDIQPNMKEILRYSGVKGENADVSALIQECLNECTFSCKVASCGFDIAFTADGIDLGFAKVASESLAKNLEACDRIILFAATVGIEIDRLILKYTRLNPSKALIFQAIGADRIESLCDRFCDELSAELLKSEAFTRPRFSPGYGDLPLGLQKNIFAVLDVPRKIGLTLNDSLIMSPTKSVTAIIGVSKTCKAPEKQKCSLCRSENCMFRGEN